MARSTVSLLVAWCAVALAHPAVASSYRFGEDLQATGPEQIVFDHSDAQGLKDACAEDHIPDLSARAFRRADGQIQMITAHTTTRRMIGPSLNSLASDCTILLDSNHDSRPERFDDSKWIASPYTTDGTHVDALVHQEYHGYEHDDCAAPPSQATSMCWSAAITYASSDNQGDSFSQATPPTHLVATIPYRYSPTQTRNTGMFSPSNIIRKPASENDDHYYAFMEATGDDSMNQQYGTCLMRTLTPADPASWRAWDGAGFNVRFSDPYANPTEPPAMHLCQPVSNYDLHSLQAQITYNSYLDRYVMVDVSGKYRAERAGFAPLLEDLIPGVYYSTSPDLIHWTGHRLLMEAEIRGSWRSGVNGTTGQCLDDDFINYPALLDPNSSSRNFDTTGATPYLYFVRTNASQAGCGPTLNRDLVRIPIRFNKEPEAAFTISQTPSVAGVPVGFDASGSSDADGPLARYEWDLDGNGTYETDTGTSPLASRTYPVQDVGTVRVSLRVTDGNGTTQTTTRLLTVDARINFQPAGAAVPGGHVKDSGLPYDAGRGFGWVTQESVALAPHGAHTPLSLAQNTRDRDLVAEQRLDTLIHMQYPPASPRTDVDKTPGAWELDVPDGYYTVRVGVGDAGCASESGCTQQRLNIEGVSVVTHQEAPPGNAFAQASRTVSVNDGKLTVDAIGGANTKLDYVEVALDDRPPIITFMNLPQPPTVGGDIRFSGYAVDPDGSIAKYEWDLDGDGTYETDSGTTPTIFSGAIVGGEVQHRVPAKVNVKLRVTDDHGFHTEMKREIRLRAKVNFQPHNVQQSAEVPYYLKDPGVAFDVSRGYGWVTQAGVQANPHDSESHTPLNMQPNARDRGVVTPSHPCSTPGVEDQLVDTFVYMQYPAQPPRPDVQQTPGAWEMSVADGSYLVIVGVGDAFGASDPQFLNSSHVINVEGQRAIDNYVPTMAAPCTKAVIQVNVSDGRLTVDALGGSNTKLTHLEIRPQ